MCLLAGCLIWLVNMFHSLEADVRKYLSVYIAGSAFSTEKENNVKIAAVSLIFTYGSDHLWVGPFAFIPSEPTVSPQDWFC